MYYCILIYDSEAVTTARTRQEDERLLAKHTVLQKELKAEGKLGPVVVRLLPTTTSTTVRLTGHRTIIDGPFAETKEQLLGFYIVNCASLEEAIETARRIGGCCLTRESGALEIRPISILRTDADAT